MDGQLEVMDLILSWVWAPILVLLLWTIRRLLGVESGLAKRRAVVNDTIAEINTKLAVMKTTQEALGTALNTVDTRNEAAHTKIERKIDEHNVRVMKRLDSLLVLAKNGQK